jgi:hypothetical protein
LNVNANLMSTETTVATVSARLQRGISAAQAPKPRQPLFALRQDIPAWLYKMLAVGGFALVFGA